MRVIGTCLVIVSALLLFFNNYTRQHLPANTYLNSRNFGLRRTTAVLNWLAKHKNPTVKVKVEERIYRFNYSDLGIVFDLNQTFRDLSQENRSVVTLFKSFGGSRTILPKLIFTQDYYSKITNLQFDFSTNRDQVSVDQKKKNLVYQNNQDIFVIDPVSLQNELVSHFGNSNVLQPKIHRVFNNSARLKVDDYNRKIGRVLQKPVAIYYENGQHALAEFDQADLHGLLSIDYQENGVLSVGIDETVLKAKLHELAQQLHLTDQQFDEELLKENLVSLINSRFNGYESDYIYARLTEKPNTNGGEADKYIEIDLSQQNMYLWERGENIAIHRVSTGLYYPTPPGRYRIMNKALNAYSYIYHVWMPYWMAFSLDPKINAYLGIHELPYWIDTSGQEIRRPRDFLGSPHTGGCVSLDIGAAQQVYDWASVGTLVLIYD